MKLGPISVLRAVVAFVLLTGHTAFAQSTEERIKQLQREQQEQRQATDRARAERISAGSLAIQGALEKLRTSGIAFRAFGRGVPGVERTSEGPCYPDAPVGFWDPVAVGVEVIGKRFSECIAVAAVPSADDDYWIEIQSSRTWCRHDQRHEKYPVVRVYPLQADVVYEVVTKFILMAVDPPTKLPRCPTTMGTERYGLEWTTPEQMK